ncbi:MAG: hypothetical protein JNM67_08425 [Bacteroidetes bacterium]|nr:hypothetical protein [Bacteroidota bacterium]
MKTIGPFEYKSYNLALLNISENALCLITLDILSVIKYHISLQVPFLFSGHFDKLLSRPLEELKDKFHWKQINVDDDLIVTIEDNNMWKNAIIIKNKSTNDRLLILDRIETQNYRLLLENLYGEKTKILRE